MYLRFIYLLYHIMIVQYNALFYLALIRPVFCIGAIVKQNWNKVCKKKSDIEDLFKDLLKVLNAN